MACRRTCVSARAISGAVATRVWLNSDSCEAAIKAGRFVWAIWLKLAPKRVMARTATPLCVTAKMPIRASPIRMASATLLLSIITRPPNGDIPIRRIVQRFAPGKASLPVRWPLSQWPMLPDKPCAPLMSRREVAQHGVWRKLVARDRGIAGLAETTEVDRSPIDFTDFGEAPRDRGIEGTHGELQAHIFF